MMMNIFSSFNSLNFLFFFIPLNLFVLNFCKMDSMENSKISSMNLFVKSIIKNDFKKVMDKNLSLEILSFLYLINMILNVTNLLPFSFCFNSQLNFFFFFSLLMWLSSVLFSFMFFFKSTVSHFTPLGCPMILGPFMVLIEIISLIIRPITLSVRMSANLLAGHLLIHLLIEFSFFLMNTNFFMIIMMLIPLLILNILEIAVAMIQPYIFCTLLNMYLSENC